MNPDIDEELLDRLATRADANGFDSTTEYTETLLRTVLDELDRVEDDSEVEERLEDLGYL